MIATRKQFHLFIFCLIVFSQLLAAEKPVIKKEKLQIVFLFGQSNMVGLADARTGWYMTQPQYAPPREMAVKRSRYFNWENFYWSGLLYYKGPQENRGKLAALRAERTASRAKWRQRARGEHGARCANRRRHGPAFSFRNLGFRLSLRPPASK